METAESKKPPLFHNGALVRQNDWLPACLRFAVPASAPWSWLRHPCRCHDRASWISGKPPSVPVNHHSRGSRIEKSNHLTVGFEKRNQAVDDAWETDMGSSPPQAPPMGISENISWAMEPWCGLPDGGPLIRTSPPRCCFLCVPYFLLLFSSRSSKKINLHFLGQAPFLLLVWTFNSFSSLVSTLSKQLCLLIFTAKSISRCFPKDSNKRIFCQAHFEQFHHHINFELTQRYTPDQPSR